MIVVPAGYGDARRAANAAGGGGPPATVMRLHRPVAFGARRRRSTRRSARVLGIVNLGGRPPLVIPNPRRSRPRTSTSSATSSRACSGLSVMQVGIFAAIPLVADREKLILKRLAATPLRRWQLVGSNVLMRLLIAMIQAVIIVGVGVAGLRRGDHRAIPAARSRVRRPRGGRRSSPSATSSRRSPTTEDSANGMTSVIQFPMMFLSGTFFPIDQMPDVLQASPGSSR